MQIELKVIDKKFYSEESNGMLLHPLPSFATEGSAAIDLYSTEDLTLLPGDVQMISTGIALWLASSVDRYYLPESKCGFMGMIVPRSGMGHKGLILGNTVGIIDSDYQGEIKISAWNRNTPIRQVDLNHNGTYLSGSPYIKLAENIIKITKGDRIAQMLFLPYIIPTWKIVEEFSNKTDRGEDGFGSTG